MGLLNELNTINRTLENNQRQLTKAGQREKEKEIKMWCKKLATENFIYLFDTCKNMQDVEELTTNLLKNKNENILFIKNNYENSHKKRLEKIYIDFISEKYLKWINEAKSEYVYIFKQEEKKQKELQKQLELQEKENAKIKLEEKKKKEEAIKNLLQGLKILCLILATPFIAIFFIIIAMCKNSK